MANKMAKLKKIFQIFYHWILFRRLVAIDLRTLLQLMQNVYINVMKVRLTIQLTPTRNTA